MKIISKFKDYYDPVAWQLGDWPVFNRKEDTIEIVNKNRSLKEEFIKYKGFKHSWDITFKYRQEPLEIIGFAGKMYPFITKTNYSKIPYVTTITYRAPDGEEEYWQFIRKQKPLFEYPIYHVCRTVLNINPPLRLFGFQKVLDPYTAATELDKFLSNLSYTEEKPIKISDDVKIKSHGFDIKKSFRKGKQK